MFSSSQTFFKLSLNMGTKEFANADKALDACTRKNRFVNCLCNRPFPSSKPSCICGRLKLHHCVIVALPPPRLVCMHRFFCCLFCSDLFFFESRFTEYSYSDTMTRIRLCSFKRLVVCFGIAILVLLARRNSLYKNLPSMKEWSTYYQELAPQLSHSQSTPIFYDIKSGFVLELRERSFDSCRKLDF